MRTRIGKSGLWVCAGALALFLTGSTSRADDIFDLNTDNLMGSPAGPYVQVDVKLVDPTHATFTFTSLTGGGDIFLMGGQGAVAVNLNASSFTLGTVTGTNAGTGFDPGDPYTNGGAGNEDGFGSFNLTINSFDGFMHSGDSVSFEVTDTSGTWTSASNVLTNVNPADSTSAIAAAHIFITTSPANSHNNGVDTGYAGGNGTPNPVGAPGLPVPKAVWGGLALLGVTLLQRRFRAAQA